jgi:hypothetical protein
LAIRSPAEKRTNGLILYHGEKLDPTCHIVHSLKKINCERRTGYMWGWGQSPHLHTYPSLLLAGGFFNALISLIRWSVMRME